MNKLIIILLAVGAFIISCSNKKTANKIEVENNLVTNGFTLQTEVAYSLSRTNKTIKTEVINVKNDTLRIHSKQDDWIYVVDSIVIHTPEKYSAIIKGGYGKELNPDDRTFEITITKSYYWLKEKGRKGSDSWRVISDQIEIFESEMNKKGIIF